MKGTVLKRKKYIHIGHFQVQHCMQLIIIYIYLERLPSHAPDDVI